ncbi:MAG: ATP-binding cassette domain-containing protein [Bacteroidales bacterium]|jgi:ATP-binding cassette subfamily F protein 3|nr:ATP-binding cassette domain-containing protein [Bacteroidales bacterium]
MITVNRLSVNFTGDCLFQNVSFVVGNRDRIGLVGKNGAGKSTLLKILHGLLHPESGDIIITSGFKTGYLPQEIVSDYTTTVWEETMRAFSEHNLLQQKIVQLTQTLENRTDWESEEYSLLSQQLADANERLHHIGGAAIEGDTEKVLCGLGFKREDFDRPLQTFSNGWQMRVSLAKILLQNPEIILLDEPTNHLDIESIQWLEEYLANFAGSLILVSHDRTFLDRVTSRTIEITFGNIIDYKCSYSQYVQQRLERIESQQSAYDNQQKQIADIERFVERFRYKATKSKQVQSKIKMLNKMGLVQVDEVDKSAIFFRFPPAPHSGRVMVELKQVDLGYDSLNVLKQIDFHLERGDRVAFVGKNGEGKSTMVKAIVGELTPQSGKIILGHQVVIGYYAQNQATLLNPDKTVFETIDDIAVGDVRPKIRAILGSFLFSSEDIEKRVKVLSGGEKSRLALAKLLLSPFNLLILDEPTNHLDMQSKDVLKNALLQYEGSMILVSHDRDFLQGLSEKVVEFKDKQIKTCLGDISDFLEKKRLDSLHELQKSAIKSMASSTSTTPSKEQWEQKKEREAQERKKSNQIKKIEAEIAQLNEKLQIIEQKLAIPEQHAQEVEEGALYRGYEEIKSAIEELEEEWLTLME